LVVSLRTPVRAVSDDGTPSSWRIESVGTHRRHYCAVARGDWQMPAGNDWGVVVDTWMLGRNTRVVIVGLALLLAGCTKDSAEDRVATEPVRTIEITAENTSFRPTILTAQPFEFIRFRVINRDQIDHHFRVTLVPGGGGPSQDQGWSLGTIPAGETKTALFDKTLCAPCDYKFVCDIHPDQMNGILRGVALSGKVTHESMQRVDTSTSTSP
jgi:plastocyanin